MTTPRRRLVRSPPTLPANDAARQRQIQRLRANLEREQAALGRWMVKLRRAFHSVEKIQLRVRRLERQIARQEE